MNTFYAILLGIIQGLTEFLPVSSSGHLVLSQHFLGIKEGSDLLFEVFLHLGTLLAVVVFFRKALWDMLVSLFKWAPTVENQTHRHNRMMIVYLTIATMGTAIIYVLFGDLFEAMFANPLLVAIMLLVTGGLIFVSDYVPDRGIPAFSMGFLRSIIIGIAQGFAIIPGISRSGTTIACSVFSGVKRKDAAQFSFLLSIPAILGANLSMIKDFTALDNALLFSYIAGFVAAFVSGYLVIAVLIRLIQQSKLKYFAFYCWLVGILSIIFIGLG